MIKKCCINCSHHCLKYLYDEECIDVDWCDEYESEVPYEVWEENTCPNFDGDENEVRYLWN